MRGGPLQRVPTILACVLVGALLAVIAVMPAGTYIKSLVIDDALYYPVIARAIASGAGSTYDGGLTQTNGYHPLWCALMVPVAALTRGLEPFAYLWWVKLLMVGVIAGLFAVWYRVIRTFLDSRLAAAVFLVWLGLYWWSATTLAGMLETPLVMLFCGLSLLCARRWIRLSQRGVTAPGIALGIALGAVMALTFLARLDSIFFLACLAAVLLVRAVRGRAWGPLAVVALTGAVVTAPYLIWNQLEFGHPVPVSGQAKTSAVDLLVRLQAFGEFWWSKLDKLAGLVGWPGVAALTAGLAAGLVWIRRELGRILRQRWGLLWIVPLSAWLHSLYTWVFMTQGPVSWYHYLGYLGAYLTIASLTLALARRVQTVLERPRLRNAPPAGAASGGLALWLRVVLVSLHIIVLGGLLAVYAPRRLPRQGVEVVYDLAVWAREHLGRDARFGMYDSGVFRFVSGRPTVSLNGLAGDPELMRLATARDLRGIIERHDLDYVITSIEVAKLPEVESPHLAYVSAVVPKPGRGRCRYVITGAEAYDDPGYTLPAR